MLLPLYAHQIYHFDLRESDAREYILLWGSEFV